jgi:hypothetical protein
LLRPDITELTIGLATEELSARWLVARALRHGCDRRGRGPQMRELEEDQHFRLDIAAWLPSQKASAVARRPERARGARQRADSRLDLNKENWNQRGSSCAAVGGRWTDSVGLDRGRLSAG